MILALKCYDLALINASYTMISEAAGDSQGIEAISIDKEF